ncbi:MAG: SCP2 sterol-binding domain-containing protein [Candidatus Helarchaeota archaeon]
MAVEDVKKKASVGEFDIQDFKLYLMAIRDLAAEDTEVKEILKGTPDFSIQFSIFGVMDIIFQVKDGEIIIEDGIIEGPNIKFEMTDIVGSGIIKNEIDPVSAYLSGDIKITGDTALAMKFRPFIDRCNKVLGFKGSD